jgi:hypothetical protein
VLAEPMFRRERGKRVFLCLQMMTAWKHREMEPFGLFKLSERLCS